jgi:hypothetical protein
MKKSKKFPNCTIYFDSEQDKKDFILACWHIHDFSVMWDKKKRITAIYDLWGRPNIKMKAKVTELKDIETDHCGASLDFAAFPFVGFLAHLADCLDNVKIRDKFLKVRKNKKNVI